VERQEGKPKLFSLSLTHKSNREESLARAREGIVTEFFGFLKIYSNFSYLTLKFFFVFLFLCENNPQLEIIFALELWCGGGGIFLARGKTNVTHFPKKSNYVLIFPPPAPSLAG
jgi:hypothetical protein